MENGYYWIRRRPDLDLEPAEWDNDGWFTLGNNGIDGDLKPEVGPRILSPDEKVKFKHLVSNEGTLYALDEAGTVWLLQDDDWIKVSNPEGGE